MCVCYVYVKGSNVVAVVLLALGLFLVPIKCLQIQLHNIRNFEPIPAGFCRFLAWLTLRH
jgi:hypothetical protein